MKDKVLVVDDIEMNRLILAEILTDDYDVIEAADGRQAIDILYNAQQLPHAVLLDIIMPEMDGFETLALIKANPRTAKIPVLFISAADADTNESRGLMEGAVDYISKPFNADVVQARVHNHIQLEHYRNDLEAMVERKTSELTATHERTLETLATIIEYRSLESGAHVRRSSELTRIMINSMLESPLYHDELTRLNYSSIIKATALHDIGKVGIPDNILLKPGRLTDEEYAIIKTHAKIGSQIIDSIATSSTDEYMYLRHCRDICRSHHERWDGTGYPDMLKGEEIPLSARIVSVIDVYDALVNERCYKPAYTHEKAVTMIVESAGTQFDPQIVERMVAAQRQIYLLEKALGEGVIEE